MTRTQLVERNCRNYELRRLSEKRDVASRLNVRMARSRIPDSDCSRSHPDPRHR